jgi:hypothetical protein
MKSLLAAIQFFTRLPIWRLCQIDGDAFRHVVEWWPVVGYLTGGTMALVLWGASMVFPPFVAVLLAIIWRLLLTGALHEDGLADVCDGFGGGTDRERILSIMKDSHVGSYGIIGLVLYFPFAGGLHGFHRRGGCLARSIGGRRHRKVLCLFHHRIAVRPSRLGGQDWGYLRAYPTLAPDANHAGMLAADCVDSAFRHSRMGVRGSSGNDFCRTALPSTETAWLHGRLLWGFVPAVRTEFLFGLSCF